MDSEIFSKIHELSDDMKQVKSAVDTTMTEVQNLKEHTIHNTKKTWELFNNMSKNNEKIGVIEAELKTAATDIKDHKDQHSKWLFAIVVAIIGSPFIFEIFKPLLSGVSK